MIQPIHDHCLGEKLHFVDQNPDSAFNRESQTQSEQNRIAAPQNLNSKYDRLLAKCKTYTQEQIIDFLKRPENSDFPISAAEQIICILTDDQTLKATCLLVFMKAEFEFTFKSKTIETLLCKMSSNTFAKEKAEIIISLNDDELCEFSESTLNTLLNNLRTKKKDFETACQLFLRVERLGLHTLNANAKHLIDEGINKIHEDTLELMLKNSLDKKLTIPKPLLDTCLHRFLHNKNFAFVAELLLQNEQRQAGEKLKFEDSIYFSAAKGLRELDHVKAAELLFSKYESHPYLYEENKKTLKGILGLLLDFVPENEVELRTKIFALKDHYNTKNNRR